MKALAVVQPTGWEWYLSALCWALSGCASNKTEPEPPATQTQTPSAKGSGCPSVCDGAASEALQQAIRRRARQADDCYQTALNADPNLAGRVLITLTVAETGAACSVVVTSTTLRVPDGLARCLERHFDADYPPPSGGCITAVVPLMLRSDADAGGS